MAEIESSGADGLEKKIEDPSHSLSLSLSLSLHRGTVTLLFI